MDTALLSRPNPSSGTPVYLQLVEQVRRGLETGALRPGDELPAISPVAETLVVPPAAVARAYRELEHRNLAVRTGGVLYATVGQARSDFGRADRLSPAQSGIDSMPAPNLAEWAARTREIASAGEVQRCLLPRIDARVEGLDYAGVSRAALGVSGDYYDFLPLPGRRLAIALGDVCGKGMPAAILMAVLRGYLHGATVERQCNPRDLISALNGHLHASVPASRFATLFYGVYDVYTRTLDYVTAGHLPPLLSHRDPRTSCHRLGTGGPALGMLPDARYASARVVLEPGDLLVAFSDGITEAMSADGEEWGEDRLIDELEATRAASATVIARCLLAAAGTFSRGLPQYDDMTVAVFRPL